jgi:methionyl aminopeptidase
LSQGEIRYKSPEDIEGIRASCRLVAETLAVIGAAIRPGITTAELDVLAEDFIHDHGATPAFKGFKGYPKSICASRNEVVVHGIPNGTVLEEGDIISIDVGTFLNGYCGDSAYTFALKGVKPEVQKLMRVTMDALLLGVEQARVGQRIGDIGFAIQDYTQRVHGYGVVRELVGHGVGFDLHEKPEVPNFGKRGRGPKLEEGLVIAIEPMITMGSRKVRVAADDWTIYTRDGQPAAHFEHTVAVRKAAADVLSTFEPIEKAVKNNPWLEELP